MQTLIDAVIFVALLTVILYAFYALFRRKS